MPWYSGPTLMHHLENVAVGDDLAAKPFRLPVQWVNRPNADFRGFAGLIVSGAIQRGRRRSRAAVGASEPRRAHPRRRPRTSRRAVAGQSVTVTLADEVDVSRGDVLAAADAPPAVADQFEATIVWMHERPMLQGRSYLMKIGDADGHRHRGAAEVQGERQHAGARRGQEARAQRHRRVRARAEPTRRVRAVRRESRSRRVHPHRPHHEHHRRRRACCTSRCAARTTSTGRRSTSTSGRART